MFKSPLFFVFIAIVCFTLVAFDNAEGKGGGSRPKSKPPKSNVKAKPPSTVTAKPIGLTTKGGVKDFVDRLKDKAKDHIAKEAVEKFTEKGKEYFDIIKDKLKGDDVEAAGDKSTEKDKKIIDNQPTTKRPTPSPELIQAHLVQKYQCQLGSSRNCKPRSH
ncbi:uncharacterized protein LOC106654739 [Trichogramma pretiosum]|uniref:uncharacterized protein LOC106654739 n=1 Tax=Trichogramma pretiosum TaxID=7493 RepID=UPI0006C9CC6A|nr:uncharacterized protein LOC106654739 [Trichogramma pretiosum]